MEDTQERMSLAELATPAGATTRRRTGRTGTKLMEREARKRWKAVLVRTDTWNAWTGGRQRHADRRADTVCGPPMPALRHPAESPALPPPAHTVPPRRLTRSPSACPAPLLSATRRLLRDRLRASAAGPPPTESYAVTMAPETSVRRRPCVLRNARVDPSADNQRPVLPCGLALCTDAQLLLAVGAEHQGAARYAGLRPRVEHRFPL